MVHVTVECQEHEERHKLEGEGCIVCTLRNGRHAEVQILHLTNGEALDLLQGAKNVVMQRAREDRKGSGAK